VAAKTKPLARVGIWALGFLVLALAGSWAYAAFWPRRPEPIVGPARRVIRVQVWNGSGEEGVGARVASYLREGGFHVVEVGNADRQDYFASVVVARREDIRGARMVASYLGDPPVIRQAWSSEAADVTVVLGSDRSRIHLDH
jgi:hypothetical protein